MRVLLVVILIGALAIAESFRYSGFRVHAKSTRGASGCRRGSRSQVTLSAVEGEGELAGSMTNEESNERTVSIPFGGGQEQVLSEMEQEELTEDE